MWNKNSAIGSVCDSYPIRLVYRIMLLTFKLSLQKVPLNMHVMFYFFKFLIDSDKPILWNVFPLKSIKKLRFLHAHPFEKKTYWLEKYVFCSFILKYWVGLQFKRFSRNFVSLRYLCDMILGILAYLSGIARIGSLWNPHHIIHFLSRFYQFSRT